MSTGIEKFRFEEKVRLCFIKHRGNLLAVSKELDVDLELVKKLGDKLKKKTAYDVKRLVAENIMQHLLLGHEQRIMYLNDCLLVLEGKETADISICCASPVKWSNHTPPVATCLKCNIRCETKEIDRPRVLELKFKAIEMLREEDTALTEFAVKMGYTDKDPASITNVRNNYLVVGSEKLDQTKVNDINQLSPMERQKARKRLEHAIIEAEVDNPA